MRKSLPFRPLALRNRLSPKVPFSIKHNPKVVAKMIEFLISGYEYYENERKSRHNEKIWLINQVKVIY